MPKEYEHVVKEQVINMVKEHDNVVKALEPSALKHLRRNKFLRVTSM